MGNNTTVYIHNDHIPALSVYTDRWKVRDNDRVAGTTT